MIKKVKVTTLTQQTAQIQGQKTNKGEDSRVKRQEHKHLQKQLQKGRVEYRKTNQKSPRSGVEFLLSSCSKVIEAIFKISSKSEMTLRWTSMHIFVHENVY